MAPAMFLIIGLVVAASRPLGRSTRFLVWLSAILWLVWNRAAGGIYRYAAPLFPAVLLATGELIPRVRSLPRQAMTGLLVLGAIVQLPPLLAAHYRAASAASVLLGWESERSYLFRILPPGGRYLPAMARAADLAGNGRVLMLGDPKTFYAPGRWVTEFEFAPTLLFRLAEDAADADRIRVGLRQRDITAALYRVEGMISMARMSGAVLHGDALTRYQEFWRRWMDPAWTDEHPAENAWYQGSRVRRVPGAFIKPASALRYTLPGLEPLTLGLDAALDAGNSVDAYAQALELTVKEPGYVAGWLRVREAGRMAGHKEVVDRASRAIQRLGFELLLRQP
jgi:hypothetical protein